MITSWGRRLGGQSLLARVWLGNSILIVAGAVVGTLLTRYLTVAGNLGLILLFSGLGISLSLLLNYLIVRVALRPLQQLCAVVERVQTGRLRVPPELVDNADPEISRLAAAINAMLARLERRSLQLRALSERAISVQEEERRRIARGLHDDTAQALSMLIINLERLQAALPIDSPDLKNATANARQLAIATLEDLRKIVFELRPTMLDDLGLIPAIRWLARSNLEPAGITVDFQMPPQDTRLHAPVETALFRITQEAVNNILRHAGAERVTICLRRDLDGLLLQIEDDGRGFDVSAASGEAVVRDQLGLLGIQERVTLVEGQLTVVSAPGAGTRLQVWVPL